MKKLPTIHERREVARSRLFRVEALELEFANGRRVSYERLKSAGLGAVIVVPVTDDGQVVLVREYAAGIHAYELGLPKGRLEPDETPEAGADRELREEAGYGARNVRAIGSLTLAPGYMSHRTQVMLARDLFEARLPGDEPEEIEVVHWPLKKIAELTRRQDVSEGRTIAALYMAKDYLSRHKDDE